MDAFRLELCDYFVGCVHPSSLNSGIKTNSEALLNVETKLEDLFTIVSSYLSCVIYYTITTTDRKSCESKRLQSCRPKPKISAISTKLNAYSVRLVSPSFDTARVNIMRILQFFDIGRWKYVTMPLMTLYTIQEPSYLGNFTRASSSGGALYIMFENHVRS